MWICLNNAFVSIIEDYLDSRYVVVRGRRIDDVENFVGSGYEITQTDNRDYRFRAIVSKTNLQKMLADCANKITYRNFKDSVEDFDLKYFYCEVWSSGVRNLDPDWLERNNINYREDPEVYQPRQID